MQHLADSSPPTLPPLLLALWHDHRGDWERAHQITQDLETSQAALVHAYLHRKEGDTGNAGYWYRRAGQAPATGSLTAEWHALVARLLE